MFFMGGKHMRKSDYIADVLKGIGIGLVVGSLISVLTGQTQTNKLGVLLWIGYGLVLIILGYTFLEEED